MPSPDVSSEAAGGRQPGWKAFTLPVSNFCAGQANGLLARMAPLQWIILPIAQGLVAPSGGEIFSSATVHF